jgi:hypothetical protein
MNLIDKLTDHWNKVDIGVNSAEKPQSITETDTDTDAIETLTPEQTGRPVGVRISSWRDSQTIQALSKHLKTRNDIKLIDVDGIPTIQFSPPLTLADLQNQTDRYLHANKAVDLLIAAADDLRYLMENNGIKLEKKPKEWRSRVLPSPSKP